MRHRRPPLQVPGDAAGLESVPQPRASDLFGVCRPVAGAGRLVQPVLQLSLQLQDEAGRQKIKAECCTFLPSDMKSSVDERVVLGGEVSGELGPES